MMPITIRKYSRMPAVQSMDDHGKLSTKNNFHMSQKLDTETEKGYENIRTKLKGLLRDLGVAMNPVSLISMPYS